VSNYNQNNPQAEAADTQQEEDRGDAFNDQEALVYSPYKPVLPVEHPHPGSLTFTLLFVLMMNIEFSSQCGRGRYTGISKPPHHQLPTKITSQGT